MLGQALGTLSGGQRRRIELTRILFSGAETLLLDEPTNHLDADSIAWLRDHLKGYRGGLVVISHDVELLDAVVNKVFHLDANRGELDQYNLGWKAYLLQRETDERRRKRERANAEKKASVLMAQADKMRAKATKTVAAQNMARRAERLLSGLEAERTHDKVAKLRFPKPSPCGKTPLRASGLSRSYGSQEVFTDVDLAIDRGSRVVVLGLNGAGKTTLLRMLAGVDTPDTGQVEPGHGLKIGYYAQEHENLDVDRTVLENMKSAAPDLGETDVRKVLGSFLFSGDDVNKPAGVLSGGEKTRLSLALLVVSSANVLLLDEPTNNLDPASREEILGALTHLRGRRRAGHATTRAPSTRSSPSASCCCPTASRTCSAPTTATWSTSPDPPQPRRSYCGHDPSAQGRPGARGPRGTAHRGGLHQPGCRNAHLRARVALRDLGAVDPGRARRGA